MHEIVAAPFTEKLVEDSDPQFRPDCAFVVSDTGPVSPLIKVRVTVDVAWEVTSTAEGWVDMIVKSGGLPKANVAVVA